MTTNSSRRSVFVAALCLVLGACVAGGDEDTHSVTTHVQMDGLEVKSIPYPVAFGGPGGGNVVTDPSTGHPVPEWPGTLVDLMAADAWAQCAAHVGSASENAAENDQYLHWLESHMTQVACPGANANSVASSSFLINGCGSNVSTCPSPMKRWARQRQVPACNVGTSGQPAVVHFYSNAETGHSLDPAVLAGIHATPPEAFAWGVAEAQKEIDTAEVNLCIAQRLRENVASSDSLLLSADDLRQYPIPVWISDLLAERPYVTTDDHM